MGVAPELRHALHVSLKGRDNETYRGTLVLKNWTLLYPGGFAADIGSTTPQPVIDDPTGASYYVIAVVLVYGMSIVMLIASHIKRKSQKLVEDKQIHKYLQEFMIVKEKSSRENYRNLKKSIVQKLNWERNPTYRNLSRAIIPAIAVPVGRQLQSITTELAMQQETGSTPGKPSAPSTGSLQPPGRRSRRGSSPAPSILDFRDTHPGSGDRKQRRKGMGNLFMQAPSLDFTHSVFEKLTELNDIRQEARARVNSIAISSTSGCSIDATGTRVSMEAESVTGSETNLDCQSETDSHITLPAITICRPAEEPRGARLTPLPTIEDVEPGGESSADNLSASSDSSDEEDYSHGGTTTAVSSEDDILDVDTDREDIWLMGMGDRSPEPRGTCNRGNSPSPRLDGGRDSGRGLQRHVHFSASTKRKSSASRPGRLVRQQPVHSSEASDIEDQGQTDDNGSTFQITCV